MILTVTQAVQYAMQAGFRGASIATIVAICMAESGLDTQAVSPTADIGIAQIHLASHADVSQACALDPACALRKAYQISNGGQDFSAWTTYNTGAYRAFLPQAQQAAASVGQTSGVPVATVMASPSSFLASLPSWWPWAVAGAAIWLVV